MAQTSGFFNAVLVDGQYDRKYNANDYSDNLAVIIGNGVLRSANDDLKVTANGLVATVGVGRAWINGRYFYNSSPYTFGSIYAPTGGNRYDRIVLRLNTNVAVRNISLAYLQGTAATNPTKPALTRSDGIYEICLADLYITANASGMTVTDTRADTDVCGWVYSTSGDDSFFTTLDNDFNEWFTGVRDELASVTLFKRYSQEITLNQNTTTVAFNIPQYDPDTCFIEVYVNGIFDTDYTISGNVLTFANTLNAGTEITVNCYKSIDGTGIMSVSDEITQLQNQYATLSGISDFTYKCTGANDNVSLSEIAQAFINGSYTVGSLSAAAESFLSALGGNTFLSAFPSDGQATIKIVGRLGATSPYAGSGTADSRYRWFSLGASGTNEKRIIFDFEKCEKVSISCATGSKNIIFFGTDLNIKNANVFAGGNGANTDIWMIIGASNGGSMNFENCRFKIVTTGLSIISQNGNFRDCVLHVKSAASNAYCIDAKSTGFVRLNGGSFYAYTGVTSAISAITNVQSTEIDAVINAFNITAPWQEQSGYYQNYLSVANAGMTQMIGATTVLNSTGSYKNFVNNINKNKR